MAMLCGLATPTLQRIWLVAVSIAETWLVPKPATGLYASAYALLPASRKAVMVARRHPRAKRECSMSVNAPCWREKLDEEKSDPSRAGTHLSITDKYPAGVDVDCDSVLARRIESWGSRRSVGDPTPAEHAAANLFRTSTRVETAAPDFDWLKKGVFISIAGLQT